MKCSLVAIFSTLGAFGCVETATTVKDVELRVAGSEQRVFQGRDGWTVEVDVARLAFGPVTLCPGKNAGEFCDTARGEWTDSTVVDALRAESRRVGYLVGTSGPVLSWMYDYGLVSVLTQSAPLVTDAAEQLDGNSVELAGCASKGDVRFCFELRTPIAQSTDTEQGVPVVRISGVRGVDDLAEIERLTVVFDPVLWLTTVDFEALGASYECSGACDPIVLGQDTQAVRAVQTSLAGGFRPQLVWKR
jgi:hypothetical protein